MTFSARYLFLAILVTMSVTFVTPLAREHVVEAAESGHPVAAVFVAMVYLGLASAALLVFWSLALYNGGAGIDVV